MKNHVLFATTLFSIFLFSCGQKPSKVDLNPAGNMNYDSMMKADSIAKNAPPVEINFTQVLDKANDKKRIYIEGYLTMPSSSFQTGDHAQLSFVERPTEFSSPFNFILTLNVGTGKNTMKTLPDKYNMSDVNVTGKNGEKIGVGDRVKIMGTLNANSDYCSVDCEEIEKVADVEFDYSKMDATKITTTKPDTSLNGKMVSAEGTLEIPTMTTDGDYTFFYLHVPGIKDEITINIAYGDGPAKLETPPANYSENDIKIHNSKNTPINNKKKVRVYGLWKDDRIYVENIENI